MEARKVGFSRFSTPRYPPSGRKKIFFVFYAYWHHSGQLLNLPKKIWKLFKKMHFYGSKSLRKSLNNFFRLITISNHQNSFFIVKYLPHLTRFWKENSPANSPVKFSYQKPCDTTLYYVTRQRFWVSRTRSGA